MTSEELRAEYLEEYRRGTFDPLFHVKSKVVFMETTWKIRTSLMILKKYHTIMDEFEIFEAEKRKAQLIIEKCLKIHTM